VGRCQTRQPYKATLGLAGQDIDIGEVPCGSGACGSRGKPGPPGRRPGGAGRSPNLGHLK
jgi:hypothetical protein